MMPRVAKATIKGLLFLLLFYIIPMFFLSQVAGFAPQLSEDFQQRVAVFAAIAIFFAVATELTSGTIYQHALSIGRALILIVYFVIALEGGILKMDLDIIEGQQVSIMADLRTYLMILISIDLLGLAKSVLQMVNFLSERTEKQLPQPLPRENP
jgi:nitrate/nitrite transporter NarK